MNERKHTPQKNLIRTNSNVHTLVFNHAPTPQPGRIASSRPCAGSRYVGTEIVWHCKHLMGAGEGTSRTMAHAIDYVRALKACRSKPVSLGSFRLLLNAAVPFTRPNFIRTLMYIRASGMSTEQHMANGTMPSQSRRARHELRTGTVHRSG